MSEVHIGKDADCARLNLKAIQACSKMLQEYQVQIETTKRNNGSNNDSNNSSNDCNETVDKTDNEDGMSSIIAQIRNVLLKDQSRHKEQYDGLTDVINALKLIKQTNYDEREQLKEKQRKYETSLQRITATYNSHVRVQWLQNIHFRLPYELRQMIYDQLPFPKTIKLSGKSFVGCSPPVQQTLETHLRKEAGGTILEEVAQMDKQIAKEMVEALIRRTHIRIEGLAHPERLLPHLLQADPFNLGIDLTEHIRHLRFAFDTNAIEEDVYHVDPECLDMLKTIRCDAVSIRIYRTGREHPQRRVLMVLDALSGWLYEARDRGYKVDCALKLVKSWVDTWRFIGTSLADFKDFKATWPKDENDDDSHKEFFSLLASRISPHVPRDV